MTDLFTSVDEQVNEWKTYLTEQWSTMWAADKQEDESSTPEAPATKSPEASATSSDPSDTVIAQFFPDAKGEHGGNAAKRLEKFKWAVAQDKILVAEEVGLCMLRHGDRLDAESRELVDKMRQDADELRSLLKLIKSDQGWTQSGREQKGVKVMYMKEKDSPFILTKTSCILEPDTAKGEDLVSLFVKYISLFKETDLMPQWFPRGLLNSNDTIQEMTEFQLVTHLKIHPPRLFPIGKRECYILGRGYDMAEKKSICISFKSIDAPNNDVYPFHPTPTKNYTRMSIHGAYYVEMETQGKGHIVFHALQMLDLKLKFVPPTIINTVAKGALPFEFVSSIQKNLQKHEDTDFAKRLESRKHFYSDLASRLDGVVAGNNHDGGLHTATSTGEAHVHAAANSGNLKKKASLMIKLKRSFKRKNKKSDKGKSNANRVPEL